MGCINGGRIKGMACVRVLWESGRGKREGKNSGKNVSKTSSPLSPRS